MSPTDDQLREAARLGISTNNQMVPFELGLSITVEPNGTIWRTEKVAYVTCTIAVPLGEVAGARADVLTETDLCSLCKSLPCQCGEVEG